MELEHYKEARPVLEEALTLNVEKDAAFHFNLGRCYTELHQWSPAKKHFLQALKMGLPEDRVVRTHFYLGTIYFQTRIFGNALQEFELCEANISKSTMPRRVLYKWLALTCRVLGREENATKYSQLAAKS